MSDPNAAAVTWGQLAAIVTIFGICGTLVSGFVAWLWALLFRMQRQHDQFRVETAEKFQSYVSTDNLREVEKRIEGVVRELREDLRRGFDQMVDLMNAIPTGRRKRTADKSEGD